jgi:type IV pilus assembly protein PilP
MASLRQFAARCLILVLAAAAVAGCSSGTSDLEQWVHNEDQKTGPQLPTVPVLQQFETFIYNDQGLRDPFAPPVDKNSATSGPRPDRDRRREPL